MECKTGNPPLLTKAIILLNVFHLFCSVTQKPHKWHIIRLRLFEMQFVHVSEWRSKQHNHSSVWPLVVEVRKDRQTNKCIILFHFCSWEELIYHQSDGARTCMVPCGRLRIWWHLQLSKHYILSAAHIFIVLGGIIFDSVKRMNLGTDIET